MRRAWRASVWGLLLCITATVVAGCNEKKEDEPGYTPSSSVAVMSFKLKANRDVMMNLDSVFFSIDLNHGVIFNADSLPMGTNITKLTPVISYASGCSAATIRMTGGAVRQGEVDYLNNPNDSIDFTGNVTLTLTAQDGVSQATYRLKVNVHKIKPDSLSFDKEAASELPSRLEAPKSQKSVAHGDGVLSMIEENNGTWTVATVYNGGVWRKREQTMPFTPDVRSLVSDGAKLYILDADGDLYSSADNAATWMSTGKRWTRILGTYGTDVLGLRDNGGRICHTSLSGNYPEEAVAEDFPVSGMSNMLTTANNWAIDPVGYISGGVTQKGKLVSTTWGFDGHTWAPLTETGLPEIQGAAVAPYFVYKQTSAMWLQTEFKVMFMFGGRLNDGSLNRKTYVTIDNGVHWTEANANLSLPSYVPATTDADVIILSTPMEGNLKDNWKTMPRRVRKRLNYELNGYDISWDCPYLHLFGGVQDDGTLNAIVWRGILARLTFMPLI